MVASGKLMHRTHHVQGLPDSIAVNNVSWKKIYDSLEPDHAPLPEPWRSELSPLQKIVTLRTLRPDKLIPALTTFVADSLGRRFVEPKPFAIEPSYNDSTCNTPLIFVLSPGRYGNPRVLGEAFAWHLRLLNRFHCRVHAKHTRPRKAVIHVVCLSAGDLAL